MKTDTVPSAVISMPPHYKTIDRTKENGMEVLRNHFGNGAADMYNFVMFSTSGVHGTYRTIEDAEKEGGDVTYLIVMPRTVCMVYGNCEPKSPDDFAFLKVLRTSSKKVFADYCKG